MSCPVTPVGNAIVDYGLSGDGCTCGEHPSLAETRRVQRCDRRICGKSSSRIVGVVRRQWKSGPVRCSIGATRRQQGKSHEPCKRTRPTNPQSPHSSFCHRGSKPRLWAEVWGDRSVLPPTSTCPANEGKAQPSEDPGLAPQRRRLSDVLLLADSNERKLPPKKHTHPVGLGTYPFVHSLGNYRLK